jgi:deoxycytidylate deaminase
MIRESLPCLHCTRAIRKFGIKKVAYSNGSGQIVEAYTKDLGDSRPSSGYRTFERDMMEAE